MVLELSLSQTAMCPSNLTNVETFHSKDFRNFVPGGSGGGTAKNPIWFSSIRDPVDKFVSRFYYARFPLKTAQRNYDTLVRENSSSVRGLSLRDWRRKDIERCGEGEGKLVA